MAKNRCCPGTRWEEEKEPRGLSGLDALRVPSPAGEGEGKRVHELFPFVSVASRIRTDPLIVLISKVPRPSPS